MEIRNMPPPIAAYTLRYGYIIVFDTAKRKGRGQMAMRYQRIGGRVEVLESNGSNQKQQSMGFGGGTTKMTKGC